MSNNGFLKAKSCYRRPLGNYSGNRNRVFSPDSLLSTAGRSHQGRDIISDGEQVRRDRVTERRFCSASDRPSSSQVPRSLWHGMFHGHLLLVTPLWEMPRLSGPRPHTWLGKETTHIPLQPQGNCPRGAHSRTSTRNRLPSLAQSCPHVHSPPPAACKGPELPDASPSACSVVWVWTLCHGLEAQLPGRWLGLWSPSSLIWGQGLVPLLQGAVKSEGHVGAGRALHGHLMWPWLKRPLVTVRWNSVKGSNKATIPAVSVLSARQPPQPPQPPLPFWARLTEAAGTGPRPRASQEPERPAETTAAAPLQQALEGVGREKGSSRGLV